MVFRTVCTLLMMAALLTTAVANADEEYIFDEEAEETASSHVPKFTSRMEDRAVEAGDTVTLPCLVDKLGETVIIWKAGNQTLFTASIPGTSDARFSLQDKGQLGNSLVIQGFTGKDSHVYQCEITSNPPITLKHHVRIQTAPSVSVRPRSGVMVVDEGREVVLECTAHGFPRPTVTWTKKGDLLPYQEKEHAGERLVIPAVKGAHMGDYTCTAENGVGEPAVEHVRVEVNFGPQIEVTSDTVYTGAGRPATLECRVQGQPLPEVTWDRVKGTALDESHYQRYQEGYRYGLRIAEVQDADLGVYNCHAENAIERQTGIVRLTGKPKPVKVTSEPDGSEKDSYTIRWSVESYAEPIEYKIIFRKLQGADEPEWPWAELTVASVAEPGRAAGSPVYEQQATLSGLQAAAAYQALVTARNRHGWSKPGPPFGFSTLGANEGDGGVGGREALVSDQPSAAPRLSLQTAGVCLLSGLLVVLSALL